ncbi:MAG: hypothetical protein HOM55_11140 [Proteobacteria bacterium]|jgi:uncharacterized damage-inducible protein DinB|nr:hypothetical protein [Pseudomonadota bacterium]
MQVIVNANVEALQKIIELIRIASGTSYHKTPPTGGSTIGRHVRHVLDHFDALKTGLAKGKIDYDQRHRDCVIETDARLATTHTKSIIDWLLKHAKTDKALNIKTEVSAVLQQPQTVSSSLKRELVYLMNHTIHHSAYTALLLKSFGEVVDESIGLAPATQIYLNSQHLKEVS